MKIPHISGIEIKDVHSLALSAGAMIFIVGPNGGGKSTFLRDIAQSLRSGREAKWIESISWDVGTETDFENFVDDQFDDDADSRFAIHRMSGVRVNKADVQNFFRDKKTSHPEFLIKLGRHGPAWVRQVIEADGLTDTEPDRLKANFRPLLN